MRKLLISVAAAAWLILPATAGLAQEPPTSTSAPEPVAFGAIQVIGQKLTVDGETVEAAPPDVEVVLTLMLVNASDLQTQDVVVSLAGDAPGVRFTKSEDAVGDINPGRNAEADFAFVIVGASCSEFLGIGGEATYDEGSGSSPIKIGIATACPGPRLNVSDITFEGGDGDGIPEPGETLRMFITLTNSGRDTATDVGATVKVTGEGVTATGTSLTWPDIASGASAKNEAPVILSISDDAERQGGCPVEPEPDARDEQPPIDQGPVPPDQAVSSDGSVSSGSGSSAGPGSSEPGSSGGGAPASTGTGTIEPLPATAEPQPDPGVVEPDPGPGTIEPGGTEPGGTEPGGTEPQPLPIEPAPDPEPAQDQPIGYQMQIEGTASDAVFALEYSNEIFCTLEGSAVATDLSRPAAARARDDARVPAGGAAVPTLLALGISVVAVVVHRVSLR